MAVASKEDSGSEHVVDASKRLAERQVEEYDAQKAELDPSSRTNPKVVFPLDPGVEKMAKDMERELGRIFDSRYLRLESDDGLGMDLESLERTLGELGSELELAEVAATRFQTAGTAPPAPAPKRNTARRLALATSLGVAVLAVTTGPAAARGVDRAALQQRLVGAFHARSGGRLRFDFMPSQSSHGSGDMNLGTLTVSSAAGVAEGGRRSCRRLPNHKPQGASEGLPQDGAGPGPLREGAFQLLFKATTACVVEDFQHGAALN